MYVVLKDGQPLQKWFIGMDKKNLIWTRLFPMYALENTYMQTQLDIFPKKCFISSIFFRPKKIFYFIDFFSARNNFIRSLS
jgi:hypothetical protein